MLKEEKRTNIRSANSLVNAIAFQYAAAILIFIKELKSVKSVGIEDENDIRIFLKSGRNIYAQAKSSLDGDRLYNDSHLTSDIKDSLISLVDNKNSDADKLISIFNFHNPFGQNPKFDNTNISIRYYHDLPSKLKNKIGEFCENDEEMLGKLEFWFLRFEDSDDPYSDLIRIVDEYIKRIDSRNIHAKELVMQWKNILEVNGRNKEVLIDFDYISGSIISHIMINSITLQNILEILDNPSLDYSDVDKLTYIFNEKFRKLVSFEEYSKALSSYIRFKQKNPILTKDKNIFLTEFAEMYYTNFDNSIDILFEDNENGKMLSTVYKKALSIAYAMKSEVIRKVKEVFDYVD